MSSIGATFHPGEPDDRLPRERPIAFALVCSGAAHLVLALVVTMALAVRSPSPPATREAPALHAMLQARADIAPLPDPLDRIEAPTLAPVILPLLLPEAPPAPSSVERTTPAPALPAVHETRVLDPNGSVTVGEITEPQHVERIAAGLTERYRVHPDRLPRLTASLIVPYPSAARQARSSARIAALIDVDEQGRIAGARLVPEDATFAPAVLEALKDARFAPAEVATHAVPYWAVLEFDFAIAPR